MAAESFAVVTLAQIVRPWGRRGEVAANILTDYPERLVDLREVFLSDGRSAPRPAQLLSCRLHLNQVILHFAGTDSINDAELLRGLFLQVPLSERTVLGADRHYIDELIGCEVWEEHAAAPLGSVEDVLDNGAAAGDRVPESWRLVVATADGDEVLIPLAAEICTRVDTAARRIEVRLPEGLRDLNR